MVGGPVRCIVGEMVSKDQEHSESASAESVSAAARIEKLRRLRVFEPRDRTINAGLERARKQITEQKRKVGAAGAAWDAAVPDAIKDRCRLESFTRGVLKVTAQDAATNASLDRWLRGGGLDELAALTRAPLHRVSAKIGGLD